MKTEVVIVYCTAIVLSLYVCYNESPVGNGRSGRYFIIYPLTYESISFRTRQVQSYTVELGL